MFGVIKECSWYLSLEATWKLSKRCNFCSTNGFRRQGNIYKEMQSKWCRFMDKHQRSPFAVATCASGDQVATSAFLLGRYLVAVCASGHLWRNTHKTFYVAICLMATFHGDLTPDAFSNKKTFCRHGDLTNGDPHKWRPLCTMSKWNVTCEEDTHKGKAYICNHLKWVCAT